MSANSYIIAGTVVTLQYTLISVALGFLLGALLSLFKISHIRVLNFLASGYISIFRGTPLLIQLTFIYYAIPKLTGMPMTVFAAGIASFSLNSAAYVAEIFRAGIESIDKGQFEAAKALGIPYRAMMKDIIFPQAFRNILPALVNEVVNLLKESALISVIGGADLMYRAYAIASEKFSYFGPLLVASACYYVLVMVFSFLAKIIENRMKVHA